MFWITLRRFKKRSMFEYEAVRSGEATVPGQDRLATLHLAVSDATGNSAIIEYIGGKQVIHHDRKYQVMTNSPIFDKQLAMEEYWRAIGGTVMLPGTNRAADRFARALFYINAIPKDESRRDVGELLQRHPECVGALWDYDAGSPKYLIQTMADGLRSEEKDLLLRVRSDAKYLLGQLQGRRLLGRNRKGNEAGSR